MSNKLPANKHLLHIQYKSHSPLTICHVIKPKIPHLKAVD